MIRLNITRSCQELSSVAACSVLKEDQKKMGEADTFSCKAEGAVDIKNINSADINKIAFVYKKLAKGKKGIDKEALEEIEGLLEKIIP